MYTKFHNISFPELWLKALRFQIVVDYNSPSLTFLYYSLLRTRSTILYFFCTTVGYYSSNTQRWAEQDFEFLENCIIT